jgi:hypothetical protein
VHHTVQTHRSRRLLILDHQPCFRPFRRWVPERQGQLENAKLLDSVLRAGEPSEPRVGPLPGPDEAPAPTPLRRVFGRPVQQVADGGRVSHLEGAVELRREEIAQAAVTRDMRGDERLVAPLTRLVAADEPAAVGGVGLDDPQPRMVGRDVLIGVDAPLLVRPADEVDAELRQDVGRIVQRLGEIVDPAPHQDPQRPPIVTPGASDDPVGPFRRCPESLITRAPEGTLFRNGPQRVWSRILV